ncbi:DUF3307 domain-containing protein [Phytohabitans houttuyneae]|uniref:DUF3307 domain-containing protein n=1 Tax=Phytohabitans houttuyneae TaxID=1076126 RepID=A0A6V8K3S3_9ACTN|nr:DUF3307 domain-containing protein [Phytohabitans houttuyneae]GFJ79802.1 hypothetical protein Phou_039820 [Phytohabitans houttuyneae]
MFADPTAELGTFGAVFAALYAAHQVADHWIQTQWQADTKGKTGWLANLACAAHVATYTLTGVFALFALAAATGWRPDPWHLVIGMSISAVTHYIADRRTPLFRLACALGSGRFWTLGAPRPDRDDNPSLGTGAYALDQSWHVGWLFFAALFISGGQS